MDARGQSEVIGLVLLLAITVAGVGVVVAAGGSALDAAQDQSSVQRAEQSMSLFDARSALVALGRADGQSLTLANAERGSYEVRPDTGRMAVVRESEDGSTTEYLNTSLGSVVYVNGDSEVAYQGGGVWYSRGAGAEMVSPPEFNYRDATLTLPVIRVTGDAQSAGGAPTARVTRNEARSNRSVFPGPGRTNPLQDGTVTVAVESDYYRGWASFFRSRTSGNVSVFPDEQRVELELVARGGGGQFSLSDTPQELRGLPADDPIQSMTFTLRPKNPSGFRPMDWSMVADSGGSEEFRVNIPSGKPCDDETLKVTATYDDGGTTHTWENDSAVQESGSAFTVDCDDGEPTLHLDLTGETNLSYVGDGDSPLENDSVGAIVNYAFGDMGPNVDLRVEKQGNGNSAGVELDKSTGTVEYGSSAERVVTFLHVTENAVNVTVE
ncbi:archaellin/type IV pilin N-terminal domain-containing protein [Halobacterium sp. CBA1126]|uniref:DUF7289 family protein n=1 Tax=Halobacterium sp. CBA1126 TaxID=2668074 RepID=UPI0012FBF3E5|nr:archaellin/type IV pilin N-terminal domain-containing protein [Halobacterium sp. CBA1126]MUV61222.1 hypothetical protein [Halobacterium sp. CBA1126]